MRQLSFGSRCAIYQNVWTEQKMASCGWEVTTFVVMKKKAMITFRHEMSCAPGCFISCSAIIAPYSVLVTISLCLCITNMC